ncbi:transcriptional regulator [Agromyces rhizosphaerae]|uniref:Transcriptional regulator n=1 Tax=Agromyces rhizosphaerae TaxID=88374 RepID=A0A9W6CPX5_9MICO|nr:helix-turn-helix domain-containing protein [Agromyces rhizosphaerae]GLI26666.1 transcriptional regulator [Agromyces rhizosphaerae]
MARANGTADLILHPVRLRVIRTLLGGRRMTTAELAAELPDVATATLYRHVSTLADAGVLDVVGERAARGATERTYELHDGAAHVGGADLAGLGPEAHRAAFAAFVAGLLADFDAYLARDGADLAVDGVGFRHRAFWMTDEELDEFVGELGGLAKRWSRNAPAPGRRRRVLSTVLIPDEERE